MWLITKELYKESSLFIIYGKSLFLAQKYEGTCKDIVKWLLTTEKMYNSELKLLTDEYLEYCDRLLKFSLGKNINLIGAEKNTFGIKDSEIEILTKAKISRNWVAHDICYNSIVSNLMMRKEITQLDKELDNHITNLIKGDFLVSKWSYEFHEKESCNFFSEERYLKIIKEWVFDTQEEI